MNHTESPIGNKSVNPNQSDPTSASSSTTREEGHCRDESRKRRAGFEEEQARVLATSLRHVVKEAALVEMYPQGRMSHHFREMCVGDHFAVKGSKYQPGQFRAFGMLAGGSGITPMFQVFLVCFI
ncbi:unnamed protein product [Brassica rapa]|uniref:Flavoprotein pyridine nucleotide cytochrome reductase-like FAD-binding domain-containing protein n=1 Tax=Brassica campestris TaxID=3711 RepID=A0A8D9HN95_BRACM|nr:unnamed protein product [Brassica rapa]